MMLCIRGNYLRTALKRILQENPSAKIVICSALEQQVLIDETLKLGAKDFIAKPIMPQEIIAALSKYC
jgi:two-component system chemotaxis response regulator CheY